MFNYQQILLVFIVGSNGYKGPPVDMAVNKLFCKLLFNLCASSKNIIILSGILNTGLVELLLSLSKKSSIFFTEIKESTKYLFSDLILVNEALLNVYNL